jgi:hypothetical protein
MTAIGGQYTMEFTTKAALAEWANDQTMPEIAAYYNGLPVRSLNRAMWR